jgi:hypothetical protein
MPIMLPQRDHDISSPAMHQGRRAAAAAFASQFGVRAVRSHAARLSQIRSEQNAMPRTMANKEQK